MSEVSHRPGNVFQHDIRVVWGDCDPANIVYTGRIPGLALDAINAWWEDKLDGEGWFQLELDRGVGTPFVCMELDFKHPVTPRHTLNCYVWPVHLGKTSIRFCVEGEQGGTLCFAGFFTCVFIDARAFSKRQPPDDMRAVVEKHLPQSIT